MDYAQLKAFFPAARHGDIDALYARFRDRHDPRGEVRRFVRYLVNKGVLDSRTLRDVLTLGPVDVAKLPGDGRAFHALQRRRRRYQRIGPLGAGAMGEVHIAADRDLQRTVAVKRIHPQHVDRETIARRFYTEAQITAQLDHPNIVPVYSFEADKDGGLSYAMKLVRGETLSEYLAEARRQLAEHGRLDETHARPARLELFAAVCAAIAYAHSRGVIHRDLKPDNIMVGDFDEVLVMDWGIARELTDASLDLEGALSGETTRSFETQAGTIIGTPQYMSPEQAQGRNDVLTAASDQYALGLILQEVVTLQQAVPRGELMDTVLRAARGETAPLKPVDRGARVPRELAAIVARATATDPADRYACVADLSADVRRFLNNEEVHASPDGPITRVARWMTHHRVLAATLFFLVVLGGLALGGFAWWRGRAALDQQREEAAARQARLLDLADVVNRRAHEVDGAFDRYEELLTGMVYAAEVALSQPAPEDQPVWLCDRFSTPGGAPPDLSPSAIYAKPISVRELCQELAPGVRPADVGPELKRLARLSHAFFRAKLESAGEDALDLPRARQEALIRDEGVPAAYTYIGTVDGIMATYPGRDTQRTDYDPRKRPWYAPATKRRGPVWIATDSLSDMNGLLLTTSMAVRAPDDRLLGVAAIDLEFVRLIAAFLEQPEIDAPCETYFLTSKGEVILHSGLRDIAAKVKELEVDPFPYPDMVPRFAERPAGRAAVDGKIILWDRISTTRWTYAVVVDEAALLGP